MLGIYDTVTCGFDFNEALENMSVSILRPSHVWYAPVEDLNVSSSIVCLTLNEGEIVLI